MALSSDLAGRRHPASAVSIDRTAAGTPDPGSRRTSSVQRISARLSTGNRPLAACEGCGCNGRENGEGGRAMRLGLFGGTFDPIHLGHLILAEQCREACGLDRVWLIVAGSPPHKPGGRTAVGHRLEMARIAIAGHPAFAVSDIEATRPGPHYSVETLESIRRDHPGDELFFLIGADSLADLPSWREPERIAQLATIVVVNRPGLEEVDPARLPDFGPGSHPLVCGHDPAGGHRLQRPPPPPGRRPDHPLHGPPRRRGLHRRPRALSGRGRRAGDGLASLIPHRPRHSWVLSSFVPRRPTMPVGNGQRARERDRCPPAPGTAT